MYTNLSIIGEVVNNTLTSKCALAIKLFDVTE